MSFYRLHKSRTLIYRNDDLLKFIWGGQVGGNSEGLTFRQ